MSNLKNRVRISSTIKKENNEWLTEYSRQSLIPYSKLLDKCIELLKDNLDKLINKLQEAKKQGIDIILCTTAREPWVARFFELKPEFKTLFDNERLSLIWEREEKQELSNEDKQIIKNGIKKMQEMCKNHKYCVGCIFDDKTNDQCLLNEIDDLEVDKLFED